MKKFTYLVITATVLSIVACTGGKNNYVITGSVEGGVDGDTVFIQQPNGRSLVKTDTAIIEKGTFTFKGSQDSTINCYVTALSNGEQLIMDFFLENGKIKIALTKENDSATGTPTNDAYQAVREQINTIGRKIAALYESLADTTLTQEQREAQQKEGAKLEEAYNNVLKEAIRAHITSPVGVHLFIQNYYNNTTAENDTLLKQLPANVQNNESIQRIKEITEKQKKTAVGTKFIDFEMQTPEGKSVKLSDYVGKGKIVLVDFWASWCGPCRKEMPNLVELYAQYKGKNFEIVGVSLDQEAARWKESIEKLNMTWPQMSDLKYWSCEGAQLYAVNSIPHTVLIDAQGTIIARGLHGKELLEKLEEAMK